MAKNIEFGGSNSDLVWKYPSNTVKNKSFIELPTSYDVIIFHNGETEVFKADSEKLTVKEKTGFLSSKVNDYKIYYVKNKDIDMSFKWGTPNRIVITDKRTKYPVSIGSYGEIFFSVISGIKLIEKMEYPDSISSADVKDFVFNSVVSEVGEVIAENITDAFKLRSYQSVVRKETLTKLKRIFKEKGLEAKDIVITDINMNEEDRKKLEPFLIDRAKNAIDGETKNEEVDRTIKANNSVKTKIVE